MLVANVLRQRITSPRNNSAKRIMNSHSDWFQNMASLADHALSDKLIIRGRKRQYYLFRGIRPISCWRQQIDPSEVNSGAKRTVEDQATKGRSLHEKYWDNGMHAPGARKCCEELVVKKNFDFRRTFLEESHAFLERRGGVLERILRLIWHVVRRRR